jgi:RND superfamily putative drug exporter
MIIYLIGSNGNFSIFVLQIATILGLGMGIDYSLFIVSRFREELFRQKGDVREALGIAVATSGKAIFFSGITVVIGLASLLLFQFDFLRSIGVGGTLVVSINVLAGLTLLPAVLALLGKRINMWKVPFLKPVEQKLAQAEESTGFWHRLAERVSKRPILIGGLILAVLVVMGSPFLHVRFGEPTFQVLPSDDPVRQASETLQQQFPSYGRSNDIYLLLQTHTGKMTDSANSAALYDYAASLKAKFPQIQKVLAGGQDLLAITNKEQLQQLFSAYASNSPLLPAQAKAFLPLVVNDNEASLKLQTNIEYSSKSAADFVNALHAYQPANLTVLVGGEEPALIEFVDALYMAFPISILLVVIVTYIALFIMFQSVILPLKAVIMTGLSLSASYGALVWVFQDGNMAGLFGTEGLGYVESTLPIIMFSVLFGLSMDYEVFLLSRVKEIYDLTGNNGKSVALGLERTGGMITSAALVMITVCGAFVTANIVIIKAVGVGMCLAVAVDSTIVRALLVPATMELLGTANWWMPKTIQRFLPKITPA